jgi:hypothetical protein
MEDKRAEELIEHLYSLADIATEAFIEHAKHGTLSVPCVVVS